MEFLSFIPLIFPFHISLLHTHIHAHTHTNRHFQQDQVLSHSVKKHPSLRYILENCAALELGQTGLQTFTALKYKDIKLFFLYYSTKITSIKIFYLSSLMFWSPTSKFISASFSLPLHFLSDVEHLFQFFSLVFCWNINSRVTTVASWPFLLRFLFIKNCLIIS